MQGARRWLPLTLITLFIPSFLVPSTAQARVAGCPHYGPVKVAGNVHIHGINEISGAVASYRHNVLWVEEDSGNPERLYAVGPAGKTYANIHVLNATNRDWEDIALANGRIWIGDIGSRRNDIQIYWFPEPRLGRTSVRAKVLRLRYEHAAQHNAEAMFVDGRSHSLYIVTKERSVWAGYVYRVSVKGIKGSVTYPPTGGEGRHRTRHRGGRRTEGIHRAEPERNRTAVRLARHSPGG